MSPEVQDGEIWPSKANEMLVNDDEGTSESRASKSEEDGGSLWRTSSGIVWNMAGNCSWW